MNGNNNNGTVSIVALVGTVFAGLGAAIILLVFCLIYLQEAKTKANALEVENAKLQSANTAQGLQINTLSETVTTQAGQITTLTNERDQAQQVAETLTTTVKGLIFKIGELEGAGEQYLARITVLEGQAISLTKQLSLKDTRINELEGKVNAPCTGTTATLSPSPTTPIVAPTNNTPTSSKGAGAPITPPTPDQPAPTTSEPTPVKTAWAALTGDPITSFFFGFVGTLSMLAFAGLSFTGLRKPDTIKRPVPQPQTIPAHRPKPGAYKR
jgi:hypothetical protein